MYTWIALNSSADLNQLKTHISSEYAPDFVAQKLEQGISEAVKGILIEHNYIDKDYRSAYYNFYSKKGQYYRSDCVRLHFFDDTVAFDEDALTLTGSDNFLTHHYFGFMVLRPTGIGTIGRSVLVPDIRKGANRYIITADHKVHLLGYKLSVKGFPSMDQHEDISVCAHAACWSILRHNSESYNTYRERLLYDVTVMAHPFDPGGLVPSQGLALFNAERIFQQAKAFPVIIARELKNPGDSAFYRQLTAYIDSKFPVFAADHTNGHAIAFVGYDWRPHLNTRVPGMRYAWDEIESFAAIDDNHLPYLPIPVSGGGFYSIEDIDAFIVALPEKVFYPADAVDRLAPNLFGIGATLGLPTADQSIIRYFITTGSALRSFVRKRESEYDPNLFKAIMMLPYAQFVWIVEIATEEQWGKNQVAGRAIIDATAGLAEYNPLWLIHGSDNALIFERKTVNPDPTTGVIGLTFAVPGHTYSRIENLRPTQTK